MRTLFFVAMGLSMAGAAAAQTDYGHYAPDSPAAQNVPVDPNHHIEAHGQGAQDPARSEVLEGWSRDMPRCLATLKARRETEDEARQVCDKILTDLND